MGNASSDVPVSIEPNSTCEFCKIHEPGVYLLNISGLVVLCLVVIVYWKEFSTMCCSPSKVTDNRGFSEAPSKVTIDQQTMGSVNNQNLDTPTIGGQKIVPVALLFPPKRLQQSRHQHMQANTTLLRPRDVIQSRLDANLNQTVEKQSPTVDIFKLPKPDKSVHSKESTGSNYLKQMMRGKHPVLSISQYEVKRLNKMMKKGDKEKPKKHHHRNRKKKQKEKEKEKQKD